MAVVVIGGQALCPLADIARDAGGLFVLDDLALKLQWKHWRIESPPASVANPPACKVVIQWLLACHSAPEASGKLPTLSRLTGYPHLSAWAGSG